VSQKHIGRDSPEEISGPHGVLKYRDVKCNCFIPEEERKLPVMLLCGAADP
jgi:hypothetical protein